MYIKTSEGWKTLVPKTTPAPEKVEVWQPKLAIGPAEVDASYRAGKSLNLRRTSER